MRGATREAVELDVTALISDTLGHGDDEFTSVGWLDGAGIFHTVVTKPSDAGDVIREIPSDANIFFGVNPVKGPQRRNAGRGAEADVTRLAALWCDLDVKPGGCPSLDVARAVVANLAIAMGTRPSVIVHSGHGLHAYWPVSDGGICDGAVGPARALLRRWERLVDVAADRLNVRIDHVYDLARMLRVPGTYNCKTAGECIPVVAYADTGGPLTIAEIDERLAEYGISQCTDDRESERIEVCPPAEWVWAKHTCPYVAKMVTSWATDGPKPGAGRNPLGFRAAHPARMRTPARVHCPKRLRGSVRHLSPADG